MASSTSPPEVQTFTVPPTSLTTITNKNILITGGSSGIGLATGELLVSLSPTNTLTILDISPPPPTSPLLSSSASRVHYHKCDLTSWPQQRAGFAAAISHFGPLDVVFVNAGIPEGKDEFFNEDVEEGTGLLKEPDRKVLEVDLNAAVDTVKLALYWLRKNRKNGKGGKGGGGGGSIVMTASLAGYIASAGAGMYSAAKHGIVGLMRALKNDTATLNIAISVVAPAVTVTPILAQQNARARDEAPAVWAAELAKFGVPINKVESIALAVGYLVNLGIRANGMGLLVQADRVVDFEAGLARSRGVWMGREMLGLFRAGREAPIFENKL
ncbi:hypothetical protein AJ80_07805 [Polytolypa hystricis UAMH7299]|uniref:NAD(P)-binding protein n=1 Tax=Polytolypa hystricis (strain UAMH7299) TaxID=1447883 RepID=A0A2B7XAL1_POLH7|nr:hypothetical protein AJ80_07805 [Polytolypa hystricis UAMH7299]